MIKVSAVRSYGRREALFKVAAVKQDMPAFISGAARRVSGGAKRYLDLLLAKNRPALLEKVRTAADDLKWYENALDTHRKSIKPVEDLLHSYMTPGPTVRMTDFNKLKTKADINKFDWAKNETDMAVKENNRLMNRIYDARKGVRDAEYYLGKENSAIRLARLRTALGLGVAGAGGTAYGVIKATKNDDRR